MILLEEESGPVYKENNAKKNTTRGVQLKCLMVIFLIVFLGELSRLNCIYICVDIRG